jgi:hypothetical protein
MVADMRIVRDPEAVTWVGKGVSSSSASERDVVEVEWEARLDEEMEERCWRSCTSGFKITL